MTADVPKATQDMIATAPKLADRDWRLKYTPDECDLVRDFYAPALECAVSYDRSTGYFSATALSLAMRGIEGLVRNGGQMRLLVGCTLNELEIKAIERGEELRKLVAAKLTAIPLEPPDSLSHDALELLSWMIARGMLDVKVAIPCDANRRPVASTGIFHEKAGVIVDSVGDSIAFNGSINETANGWLRNWESFNVFCSWQASAGYVEAEAATFAAIWAGKGKRVMTLDVPEAVRKELLRFLPSSDAPARLQPLELLSVVIDPHPSGTIEPEAKPEPLTPPEIRRTQIWGAIDQAALMTDGGAYVGEATCSVRPWPHQINAFERLRRDKVPRLLIADEVGLGKTIQVGMLLRQAWLERRVKRVLILTPAAVMSQWQLELREKFNLNWPIYDDGALHWCPSPSLGNDFERDVGAEEWHREPFVIASSHLMRRKDRARELCDRAEPWDLVVLDEAHHARRRGAGSTGEHRPNSLLRLMRQLRLKTDGLVLVTATPMQVHPVEVWDLLDLLGLPIAWSEAAFLRFFAIVDKPAPSYEEFEETAELFRMSEAAYGRVLPGALSSVGVASQLKSKMILSALRDKASVPRRQLSNDDRTAARHIMRANTPIAHLVSRHTRDLLRRYYREGRISTPIAERYVEDSFIEMSSSERACYEAVEDYISSTYSRATPENRDAVGFIMTVYRRRLASSFRALRCTLESRRSALAAMNDANTERGRLNEDASASEALDEPIDVDTAAEYESAKIEEGVEIEALLQRVAALPVDTKAKRLKEELSHLRKAGYAQAMVFTQYTDTMDFLRKVLEPEYGTRMLCFSGRGGQVLMNDGTWRFVSRDDVKRRFRQGDAELLLCTDAAAEGLNFQFCGALVNYDMPWNPMKVEQRIGRIDRLGQRFKQMRIVNLHYADTVESDVYMALRKRINLFVSVVGKLQPILSTLSGTITSAVLAGSRESRALARANAVSRVETDIIAAAAGGLDLDAATTDEVVERPRPVAALTMDDLDRVIVRRDLMPPGIEVSGMGAREYRYLSPGMERPLRVTTDPVYYEENSDSLELWSPGSPTFPRSTPQEDQTTPELPVRDLI
jgi:superfamily II DNA or RNA helicase